MSSLAARLHDLCVLKGTFTLRSGRTAAEYFDKYRFEADPETLAEVTRQILPLIPPGTEVLAGLEMGGIALVTMLSHSSSLPAAFVRKTAKPYGTARLCEGADVFGKQVLIVEDVVTSGGQVVLSAGELRKLGDARVVCRPLNAVRGLVGRSTAFTLPFGSKGILFSIAETLNLETVTALIVSEPNSASTRGLAGTPIRVSQIISSLSYALDLTEGQPMGHSVRTCVFGMQIAKEIGLPIDAQADLYYALLMKDAGCSTNASRMFQLLGTDDIQAKRDVKTTDWTRIGWESLEYALTHVRTGAPFLERVRALFDLALHNKKNANEMVQIRCERGAAIARRIGLSEATASAIHSLDELWNGSGHPDGLRGQEIPILARIMSLAQTVDVFFTAQGPAAALNVAEKRSGRWFDPDLAGAFCSVSKRGSLWPDIENAATKVLELEPRHDVLPADERTLDNICLAFADVIDAKSPFTYRHSTGVAGAAVAIAKTLGMPESEVTLIRRAALLHDIGKLSVPNTILDKPGKLTESEWDVVRKHPHYSYEILKRIPDFSELSEIAASHHEKLNGTGYFRGMTSEQLGMPARILVVSDIYDALAAKRPYRDALPLETVLAMMGRDTPHALDATCFEALKWSAGSANSVASDLYRLSLNFQENVDTGISASDLTPPREQRQRQA